jgi:hypothetical protein
MFIGQKIHDDDEIKKAQEFIENNFMEKITVMSFVQNLQLVAALLKEDLKRQQIIP